LFRDEPRFTPNFLSCRQTGPSARP